MKISEAGVRLDGVIGRLHALVGCSFRHMKHRHRALTEGVRGVSEMILVLRGIVILGHAVLTTSLLGARIIHCGVIPPICQRVMHLGGEETLGDLHIRLGSIVHMRAQVCSLFLLRGRRMWVQDPAPLQPESCSRSHGEMVRMRTLCWGLR